MKHNSHCIVCKQPATAPRGNYNAKKPTLCFRKKCRHTRKIELQRARRAQKELFDKSVIQALTLPDDKARKVIAPALPLPTADTTSIADNYRDCDALPSRAKSRPPRARAERDTSRISRRAGKKPRRGKRAPAV
jgi:hypothetical protein